VAGAVRTSLTAIARPAYKRNGSFLFLQKQTGPVEALTAGPACAWRAVCARMINYTERIALLVDDIVARVPALSYIDTSRLLIFARFGRSQADGAYATCHCVNLPTSEPGYYFWRDRRTGRVTRRSQWFVTKSPTVQLGPRPIDYLISFCLPRFCDQTFARSRKCALYPDAEPWMAKLDTIVHELYHIDPEGCGIRKILRADGSVSPHAHSPAFFRDVARMVREYLASGPNALAYDFLRYDFDDLAGRFGGVVGTAFRPFPTFPQRYVELAADQPAEADPAVRIEPLKQTAVQTRFTADDLHVREFMAETSRRLVAKGQHRAA
jgi:hypothetical protein